MAKIKFGMMMTDARGKLGGHVFTKTRVGATIRTKVTPVNRRTSAQMGVRAAFGSISQLWSNDPTVEREAWEAAAADLPRNNIFGDQYILSGKSYFMSANQNRHILQQPPLLAPAEPEPGVTVTLLDTITDSALDELKLHIDLSSETLGSNNLVIAATRPNSLGRNNFSGQYRIIQVGVPTSGSDEYDIFADYSARFGEPVVGKKISFQVHLIQADTGLATPPVVATVVYE